MPAAAFQLPPKNTPVLICEGESDLRFLVGQADHNIQGVFTHFAPQVWVYQAGGEDRAKPLASLFPFEKYPQVAYICDRDFKVSHAQGLASLTNHDRKTYWSRPDIESYLLYPDWLLAAFKVIQTSPKFRDKPIPPDEITLYENILAIAEDLVLYHAGNQTMQDLMLGIKSQIQDQGVKRYTARQDWENYLVAEAVRYREMGRQLSVASELQESVVLAQFQTILNQYQNWSTLLDDVQIHFSGKRIFMGLAEKWQSTAKGAKYSWQVLRDLTLEQAVAYSSRIQGLLSDDPRLGDFGLLASKILGRKV